MPKTLPRILLNNPFTRSPSSHLPVLPPIDPRLKVLSLQMAATFRGPCPPPRKPKPPCPAFRARRWRGRRCQHRLRASRCKIWNRACHSVSHPRGMAKARHLENQIKSPGSHSGRLASNPTNLVSGPLRVNKEGNSRRALLVRDIQPAHPPGWHLNPVLALLLSFANSLVRAARGRTASRRMLPFPGRRSRAHSPSCCLAANRRTQHRLRQRSRRRRRRSRLYSSVDLNSRLRKHRRSPLADQLRVNPLRECSLP